MNQNKSQPKKVAVVTGSSSGIGRAIAIELARSGADVVLHGRSSSKRLDAVSDEIKQLGCGVGEVHGDFAQSMDWEAFVESAWKIHGRVDYWVNNAGGDVLTGNWPEKTMEQKLDFLWRTDVTSSLFLSKAVGWRMNEELAGQLAGQKPEPNGSRSIVNIGWDQAWQGMGGDSGELFSTTKGAVMSMTKSLAQTFAPCIRVNCVAPGWIKTKWGEQTSEYWNHRAENESLMGRWGTPEDVAKVVAFACSEAASFISGQIIPVNGGFRYGV
jgi:3-oxoacyl-[acyl-carrier protein] reductase